MTSPPATVSRGSRQEGGKTAKGPEQWFTGGVVYVDPCLSTQGNDPSQRTACATVTFTPGARTNWHWNEIGQLLEVEAGSGWVYDKGAKPIRIHAGDSIWCPPSVVHWHGADEESIMTHYVLALGAVEWYDPVSDDE